VAIKNQLQEQSKASFILHNMFTGLKRLQMSGKIVDKHPFLYSIGIVYRWRHIIFKRRNKLSTVIKNMHKINVNTFAIKFSF
jgi:hypothetical protein